MKEMLRIEFSRALKNKYLLFAILLGCAVTVSHFVLHVVPTHKGDLINAVLAPEKIWYPNSVFNQWIGETSYTMQTTLYYLLLPILAALPFADSFFLDMKTGYIKNVFIRINKSRYYIAKYLSTFVAGGIAVVVPLLLNLALTASVFPSLVPEGSTFMFGVYENNLGSGIFITHPYLYTFLYLALDFVFAGLLAGVALTISFFVSNRFIVVLSPFIGYLVFNALVSLTGNLVLNPDCFLQPSQPISASPAVILVEAVVLAMGTMGVFFYKGAKDETF